MGKARICRGLKAGGCLLALTLFGVALPIITNAGGAAAAGACGPPVVSVIACENTATGDPQSDWLVSGAGDQTLQGFATAISVNAGQTVSFKISSTQSAYHIDILRLGYYQGTGARKVAGGIAPSAPFPQTQPACLTDSATGLVDCGNWGLSASWAVPTTAVSGVYFAHLVRNDNGAGSDVPFIVRNDSSHSDIVFQTSDETWQAYNTYGGNSLYQCTVACPPGNPQAYKAAYKVSYNRPFHSGLDDSGRSWVTYAELPMIKFIEANGYDVSYIAGTDADISGALLLNHKMFMSTGHDEYWSGNQRANVENARDHGVNLCFFSGNEVFWKTRFEPSIDGSSTPQRTLTSYKETHFDAPVDPKDPPIWTGTWEDPRFSPPADGGRPSNSLTGQKFIVNSGTTDIQVPAAYSQLRMWRNTAVAALAPGQSLTLGQGLGTLGYEWDEDTDNGFRPPGLFDLSLTTSNSAEIFTDYGSHTSTGKATHKLTIYRAPSGALVFGAGTVQWSWGLDNTTTGGATDRNMQQATVNLFADMGVQPFALISGLVTASPSTDHATPTSIVTSPSAGANLSDGSSVTINGTASDAGGGVVAGVEVSTDGGTTWHPANGTSNWTYTWSVHGAPSTTIKSRAVDDSGNLETPSGGTTVNVSCSCSIFGPTLAPTVVDSGDGNSIEVGLKFTSDVFGTINGIRFYKATANTGTHVGNLWTSSGQLLASATFTGETASGWQQVNFSKPVPVNPGTQYIASYFAPKGHYSGDDNYFYRLPQSPNLGIPTTDSPPLHAAKHTSTNPNGVYNYTGSSAFPNTADFATNYWVDVTFTPQPAPGTPTNPVATAGYASAGLSWTAPASGGPATTYTVTPYVGSSPQAATTVAGSPAPTVATVTGLTNGTTYSFTITASNPAGTGTASAQSNAVTPSASAPVIVNGGFENGISPWVLGGGNPTPALSTAKAHSGTTSLLLGAQDPNPDANGNSSADQTITVPTGTSQLSFWYWTASSDSTCSGAGCTFDWTEAQIRTPAGSTLAQIFKSNTTAQAWAQVVFDTTPYAGQTVDLYFNVHGDGSPTPDNTWTWLDDVAMTTSAPPTPPTAPTGVTATAGSGSATVSWTAPSNGGSPITAYTVTPFIGSAAQPSVQVTGSPPATSVTVTGLTPNTSYTFTAAATNAVGTGPASAPSNAVTVGPATRPSPPTNVTGTPGNTIANVSWTAPSNGGSPITSYTVTAFNQGETGGGQVTSTVTGSPPPTSLTVTGLTNGNSYAFSVVATNAVGPSQPSALSSAVVPGTLPSAPTNVSATAGMGSATISWTAPSDGGSPITSYVITPYVGTAAQVATTINGSPPTTTATVAVTNGTTYTFTVSAVNGVGAGPASAPSNAVTPFGQTVPGAPTGVTGSPGDSSAVVSWSAPATNGGSPITSYVVTPFAGTNAQPATTVGGSPPATSTVVSGLTNGTAYTFSVNAVNAVGTGPTSTASAPVTPQAPPAAPSGVFATSGNGVASVSWTAPSSGSPITGYTVTPYVGGNPQTPTTLAGSPPVTSTVVPGLTNGTTYTFRVSASSAAGTGPSSAPSYPVTPESSPPACPCSIFGTGSPAVVDSGDGGSVVLGVAFSSDTGGYVTGIRFYKAAANGGTHVGTLWANGTALASATFANETASGWQQVTFANPIAIAPGTAYVASYLAPFGRYSYTSGGLASGVDTPPLHALANSTTPNGVYVYSATNAYPTSSFNASNYAVDPVFSPSTVPGAPGGVSATPGNASAAVSWSAPSNGGSPITSYTITPYIGATAQTTTVVSGSPPAVSATVTGLTNGKTYTFKVSATNALGTGQPSAASGPVTPQGAAPVCPCTIFGSSTPAVVDSGDTAAVVLGVAFSPDTSGYVTGLRFYKSTANTGTHTGTLWSSTGTSLASATFTNETASGWQTVTFSSPVAVTAGTTYVASYLAPAGRYSYTSSAFASSGVDNPPLHALANTTTPNGLYVYSSTSTFPTSSYNATNYWVDVVFNQTVSTTAPAAPTGVTATGGNTTATVTWTAPASGGSPITSYTVTPFVGTTAQTATVVSPPATSVVVSGLTNGTSYTFQVAATNSVGTGPSATSNAVTPQPPATCPCTIFGSATPSTVDSGDGGSVVLGVAFKADVNGFVTGVRFYKSVPNTGTHVGALWSSGGSLLASATFSAETASGWQQVSFSSPVAVLAGVTYVASYLAPGGHYSVNSAAFASAGVDNPPLHALANTTTPNGLFVYSSGNAFPTGSFNATNYWVDPVFQPGSATVPGVPGGVTASPGYPASATVSWTTPGTGGSPITSYTITPFIGTTAQTPTTVGGSAVSATVTGLINDSTYTFQVAATNAIGTGPSSAPSSPVTPHASAPACPCTLFGSATPATVDSGDNSSVVLGVAFNSDTAGYVTGVRFYKSAANTGTHIGSLWSASGQLLASATFTGETGSGWQQVTFPEPVAVTVGTTYVATYLAPAGRYSFTGAAFGAQVDTVPLHALASSAVPNGNGLYSYSAANVFPTNSFNATNYWVDPVFSPTSAPGAPTSVTATGSNAAALVSWTAPANGGSPVTTYTVTPFIGTAPQAASVVVGTPPATNTTVSGLTNGTTYTFTVSASNAVGTGPPSAASNAVTPAQPPGTPTNVSATGGNAAATVSWTAPPNGGLPISQYTVTPFIGSVTQTAKTVSGSPPATSVTVTGLTNGTAYTFKVAATNAVGTGPQSAASNAVTPAGPPAAPTNVVATAHASSAAVSWTAPSDGGSPLTMYTVTPFIGSNAQTPTTVSGSPPATSVTVSGLTAGTTYTFKVSATNAVGTGPQSAASNAVTPCLLLC